MGSSIIRLIIVEDQPAVRKMLHLRLAAEEDIYVIGEAQDCETALDLATSLCPDIVLVDVDIPGVDGMQIVRELNRKCPKTALVVLSILDDPMMRERVRFSGAEALVVKSLPTDTLIATIRNVGKQQFNS